MWKAFHIRSAWHATDHMSHVIRALPTCDSSAAHPHFLCRNLQHRSQWFPERWCSLLKVSCIPLNEDQPTRLRIFSVKWALLQVAGLEHGIFVVATNPAHRGVYSGGR